MGKLSFALSWISKISFRNKKSCPNGIAYVQPPTFSSQKNLIVLLCAMLIMLCAMQSSLLEAKWIIVFFQWLKPTWDLSKFHFSTWGLVFLQTSPHVYFFVCWPLPNWPLWPLNTWMITDQWCKPAAFTFHAERNQPCISLDCVVSRSPETIQFISVSLWNSTPPFVGSPREAFGDRPSIPLPCTTSIAN